jgi:hypothetical protein
VKSYKKWVTAILVGGLVAAPAFADVVRSTVGAEGDVKGSVSDVKSTTQDAFKQMGIVQSGSSVEKSGAQQSIEGKKGDKTVDVQLSKQGPNQTRVSVTTKEGGTKYNKDYAQSVLSNIVQRS